MGRAYVAMEWQHVPGIEAQVLTIGTVEGLPAFKWGWADRTVFATRAQLRAMGKRPNGQDPKALLIFRHRKPFARETRAPLYLIAEAAPVRPMTPARQAALDKAMTARRTCKTCKRDVGYCVPTSTRECWSCWETSELENAA